STGCPVTGDLSYPRRRELPVPPLLAVDSGPLQRLGPSLRSARRQEPPGPGALPGPRPDGDDRHGLGPGHGPVPGFRGGDRPGRSRGDHLLRDRLPDRRDDRPGHGRDGLPASRARRLRHPGRPLPLPVLGVPLAVAVLDRDRLRHRRRAAGLRRLPHLLGASIPIWAGILLFAALIVGMNLASVGSFGVIEFFLSSIKVIAVFVFILIGAILVFVGMPGQPAPGLVEWTADGGFAPTGWAPVWIALSVVM